MTEYSSLQTYQIALMDTYAIISTVFKSSSICFTVIDLCGPVATYQVQNACMNVE
jgi:hypothetical protein